VKRILYLGNKLSTFGFTPTGVEFLGKFLEANDFSVIYGGAKRGKLSRLFNMLISVIQTKKYDVILIDMYSTLAFYYCVFVCVLARIVNKPYIPILRGGDLPTRFKRNPALTRQIIVNAYEVVSVSQYLQEVFQSIRPIKWIPNFIKIMDYPFVNRQEYKPQLLWVRSLHQTYNPELAVRIVDELSKNYPNATLTMVGPDKDGSKFRVLELAKELGIINRITLTGKLSKPEWIAIAAQHDIFINTTNYDNMPVSLVEAMALGLPIVTTDVGGIPYLIVNGKNGLMVPQNDVNSFCRSIELILNKPEIANMMANEGRLTAEGFDEKKIGGKWANLLKK
jgi:L-malate glycosyltransferase